METYGILLRQDTMMSINVFSVEFISEIHFTGDVWIFWSFTSLNYDKYKRLKKFKSFKMILAQQQTQKNHELKKCT